MLLAGFVGIITAHIFFSHKIIDLINGLENDDEVGLVSVYGVNDAMIGQIFRKKKLSCSY